MWAHGYVHIDAIVPAYVSTHLMRVVSQPVGAVVDGDAEWKGNKTKDISGQLIRIRT